MTRFEVMKRFTDGFAAGISGAGISDTLCVHWNAGYEAGYKQRPAKNAALDAYLISTGRNPQAVIRLNTKDC